MRKLPSRPSMVVFPLHAILVLRALHAKPCTVIHTPKLHPNGVKAAAMSAIIFDISDRVCCWIQLHSTMISVFSPDSLSSLHFPHATIEAHYLHLSPESLPCPSPPCIPCTHLLRPMSSRNRPMCFRVVCHMASHPAAQVRCSTRQRQRSSRPHQP